MARLARRSSHPRRLTLLSIAATAALLVGVLGLGGVPGGPASTGSSPTVTDRDPEPTAIPPASPSPSPFPATTMRSCPRPACLWSAVVAFGPTGRSWGDERDRIRGSDRPRDEHADGRPDGSDRRLLQGMSVGANGVRGHRVEQRRSISVESTSLAWSRRSRSVRAKVSTDTAVWVADTTTVGLPD
jgi:hypothetical protein